jgi:hypothetical protein
VLHPSDRFLFVSNQGSNSITVLAVGGDGSLTLVPGSPFPALSSGAPGGMAVNHTGGVLYAAKLTNQIEAFTVAGDGVLAPLPGSPFVARARSAVQSIAFFLPCGRISLSPALLPGAQLGEAYRQVITAAGGRAPHAFALASGELPPGLGLSAWGVLEGTPTVGGPFEFTVMATDADGCRGSAVFAMSVLADVVPPTTVATPSPAPWGSGWYHTDVAVRLVATDNPGGSGVAWIGYSLTGAQAGDGRVSGDAAEVWIRTEWSTTLTYFAVDAAGNREAPKMLTVRIDKTRPGMACAATPSLLWPPDHRMKPVMVTVRVADGLSGPAGFTLTSVVSSEKDAGLSDGDVAGDIQEFVVGTPDTSGWLRAERWGRGAGRRYTLTYTGRDAAGNTAECAVTVLVPHHHEVAHHDKLLKKGTKLLLKHARAVHAGAHPEGEHPTRGR